MRVIAVYLLFVHQTYGEFDRPVDIGYGFDAHTIYWPGMPTFNLTVVEYETDPYILAKRFDAGEHGGTHLDAPVHFNPDGWKVGEIPLERLLVPGVVIDLKKSAENNPDAVATVKDLEQWEKKFGPLPPRVAVIFNFGWAPKYKNRTEYLGTYSNNANDFHFPGVSKEAAEWLVNSSKVVGVGVDTASIDAGNNKEFIAHQILTAANIYLMENLALANADLPPRDIQLTVMPFKINNGTGAPLRIIASPSEVSFLTRILSAIISFFGL